VHLVGFITQICQDAWSTKRKKTMKGIHHKNVL